MRLLSTVLVAAGLLLAGCSKKNSSNPVSPGGANPAQPNVTFTMHLQSGTQGMKVFASPSADVKLTKVVLSYPAGQFTDEVTNPNPDAVFQKNASVELGEYVGIDGGQQWVLVFHGSLASTGQAFTITVNWTVV